jgi:hypothetical protein
MLKRILIPLLEIAVCLVCLVYVGLKTDLAEALDLLKQTDWLTVATALVPLALAIGVLPFRSAMRSKHGYLSGLAITLRSLRGLFQLGAIGVDRHQVKLLQERATETSNTGRERFISIAALALVGLIAGLGELETAGAIFILAMVLIALVSLAIAFDKWSRPVSSYMKLIGAVAKGENQIDTRSLIADLMLGAVAIVIMAVGWMILADVQAVPLFFSEALLLQVAVLWALLLPLAPLGIGPRELVIFIIFERLGVFGGYSLVLSLYSLILLLVFILVGELIGLASSLIKIRKKKS